MSKGTCELRALEPGPGSANRGPAGAAGTKCCGLSAGEANAGTVLIEESAATLTQFLLARLNGLRLLALFPAATLCLGDCKAVWKEMLICIV